MVRAEAVADEEEAVLGTARPRAEVADTDEVDGVDEVGVVDEVEGVGDVDAEVEEIEVVEVVEVVEAGVTIDVDTMIELEGTDAAVDTERAAVVFEDDDTAETVDDVATAIAEVGEID